jgi:hypothetical protein
MTIISTPAPPALLDRIKTILLDNGIADAHAADINARIIGNALWDFHCPLYGDPRPMSEAPRDGTKILVLLKSPIPDGRRGDDEQAQRWDGLPFVARHPGVAADGFDIGWQFAAPIGHGGFPDEWFVGWRPLPGAES